MQIYYRILSLNEREGSILVRYWSDEMSERELSSKAPGEETSDTPEHCRTDINYNIFDQKMTQDQLHDFLMDGAPEDWLGMKGRIKNPTVDTSLSQLKGMVGVNKLVEKKKPPKLPPISRVQLLVVSARDETDITELLEAVASDKDPPGRVILANVKTKLTGKWSYPTSYTPNEVQTIVNPYLQLLYSSCPGVIAPTNTNFETSDTFVVKFLCEDIAAARRLHRWLTVDSKGTPEQQALMALSKRYQEAAGATYAVSWRLSYVKGVEVQ